MAGFIRRRIGNFFQSCTVGTQPISHDNPRVSVVSYCFLQEPAGRFLITSLGRVNLKNLAFMINGTPQIMLNTVDFHENLVQMPPPMCSVTSLGNAARITSGDELKHRNGNFWIGMMPFYPHPPFEAICLDSARLTAPCKPPVSSQIGPKSSITDWQ